jgi:DNA-3-methyladenine glycosylase II
VAFTTEAALPVVAPYRLDLTVAVLRRFSTNVVDVFSGDGSYYRAFDGVAGPSVVRVRQRQPAKLDVAVDAPPGDEERVCALARRMLGGERDMTLFARRAARVPWLRALARRLQGVKPPRYPTLWEACVNAVVFQQISLLAASAILRRIIESLGARVDSGGTRLYVFPGIETLLDADDALLRAAGLSAGKVATLRRVGEALATGALDEVMLEARSSPAASQFLCGIKGIGPWTAAVILLRGLGRLDVFPANDSGAARGLAALAGGVVDLPVTLATLGDQRGMLYYHLLLARLEACGEIAVEAFAGRGEAAPANEL